MTAEYSSGAAGRQLSTSNLELKELTRLEVVRVYQYHQVAEAKKIVEIPWGCVPREIG